MGAFLILECDRCGGFLLAKAEQRSRTCPYCGFKIVLHKAKKVASAINAYEASNILQKLKRDASLKRKKA